MEAMRIRVKSHTLYPDGMMLVGFENMPSLRHVKLGGEGPKIVQWIELMPIEDAVGLWPVGAQVEAYSPILGMRRVA